ncbi:MAG: tRNA (guanosine(18)-2'-O)-methyltransferase TrmH [Acidobacteriota bacterium]
MSTARRHARMCAILDRRQPDLTVLMDNVHKPHNVSAVLRTCDAVGIARAHAVSPDPHFRVRHASAAGVGRYVEVRVHADHDAAFDALRAAGMAIYAAHPSARAVDFRRLDYTRPTALLLGSERDGVDRRLLDRIDGEVIIPMLGAAASLNVSVAAAVMLFEAQRQRLAAGFYDAPRLPSAERDRLRFIWTHPRLAAYCDRHALPYPSLDEDGLPIDPLPRLDGPPIDPLPRLDGPPIDPLPRLDD